jgi:hypothetical protein
VKSLERAVEKYRPLSLPVIAGSYPVRLTSYILAENSLAENIAPPKQKGITWERPSTSRNSESGTVSSFKMEVSGIDGRGLL